MSAMLSSRVTVLAPLVTLCLVVSTLSSQSLSSDHATATAVLSFSERILGSHVLPATLDYRNGQASVTKGVAHFLSSVNSASAVDHATSTLYFFTGDGGLSQFLTTYHPLHGFRVSPVDLKQLAIYSLWFSEATKTLYAASIPGMSGSGANATTAAINEMSMSDGIGKAVVQWNCTMWWSAASESVVAFPEQFVIDHDNNVVYVGFDTIMDVHGTGPSGVLAVSMKTNAVKPLVSIQNLAATGPIVMNSHGLFLAVQATVQSSYTLNRVDIDTGAMTTFLTLVSNSSQVQTTDIVDVDAQGRTYFIDRGGGAIVVDFDDAVVLYRSTVQLPDDDGIAAIMIRS